MSEQQNVKLPRDYRAQAVRIANAVTVLRRLHRTMPMQLAVTYLHIAEEEGLTVGALARRCRIQKSVASRHLQDLGTSNRHGKPGLGLVVMTQRVHGDRRERHVYLTELGRETVRQIGAALKEARPRRWKLKGR